MGADAGDGVEDRPFDAGDGELEGVSSGDGCTHGGVMTSIAGRPGAGEGDAVALGVFSGITPLGNGVGHIVGNANQCSVNPLATEALAFFPK
jgi:hypothetical protein